MATREKNDNIISFFMATYTKQMIEALLPPRQMMAAGLAMRGVLIVMRGHYCIAMRAHCIAMRGMWPFHLLGFALLKRNRS